jgi:hypothetical protein
MDDEKQLPAGGIGRPPVMAAEAHQQVGHRLGGKVPASGQLRPDLSRGEVVRPSEHPGKLPCDGIAEPALNAQP